MSVFDHALAMRRLHEATFGLHNRRVADCWLAQWRSDALPLWPLDVAPVADLAPGLVGFELRTDDTLICILCGGAVRASIGMDIVGKDWVALALPEQRAERLKGYRAIAAGAVGHCMRHGRHRSGSVKYVEEILLPFAPLASGARPVLVHIGYRPRDPDPAVAEFYNMTSVPDEISLIPLSA